MPRFLRSPHFWLPALLCAAAYGLVFAWELGKFSAFMRSPMRPPVTSLEWTFTLTLIFLFALDGGLYWWRKKEGTCPIGVRRASGIAATFGAVALLCPACTIIPITLLGATVTLGFLAPFLPLLRFIAFVLLVAVALMLWPRRGR